ncbi:MAG TPA: hypothetical protein VLG27_01325 [Candidatus Saccharimonadia bacterium]|nr:hypothetical protein [Candidatus Saccharimonadia bacterium]
MSERQSHLVLATVNGHQTPEFKAGLESVMPPSVTDTTEATRPYPDITMMTPAELALQGLTRQDFNRGKTPQQRALFTQAYNAILRYLGHDAPIVGGERIIPMSALEYQVTPQEDDGRMPIEKIQGGRIGPGIVAKLREVIESKKNRNRQTEASGWTPEF